MTIATRLRFLAIAGLVLAASSCSANPPAPSAQAATAPAESRAASLAALDGFDPWLDQAMKDFEVPGLMLAIVKDGQVIAARGYGFDDVEDGVKATDSTLFSIGSAGKAFTTHLLGQLVDEGLIEWDKPVRAYMPEFELHDPVLTQSMTVRDLVTHRSGLPRHDLMWYNNWEDSREDLVGRLRHLPANKGLREVFQYNNLMFMTAGHLAERVTGKSYEDNIRERLFKRMGMKDSRLENEKDVVARMATPYGKRDDVVAPVGFRAANAIAPAGGIMSSARDMARWLLMHLGGGELDGERLLRRETETDMLTPHMAISSPPSPANPEVGPQSYGMGWFLDSYRGHNRAHHGGNIDGFSTLVTMYPNDGLGIAVAVNMEASPLPNLVSRHVADRMLALERRDWAGEALARRQGAEREQQEGEARLEETRVPGTAPAHDIAEYAGAYRHDGYGTIRVVLKDGALRGDLHGIPLPLEHWHFETFRAGEDPLDGVLEGLKLTFVTGEEGDIDALTVTLEPSLPPFTFTRLPDGHLKEAETLAHFEGSYLFANTGDRAVVSLRDTQLAVTVPGNPPLELDPLRGTTFAIRGLQGFRVRFTQPDGNAPATEVRFLQPDGVFVAQREK